MPTRLGAALLLVAAAGAADGCVPCGPARSVCLRGDRLVAGRFPDSRSADDFHVLAAPFATLTGGLLRISEGDGNFAVDQAALPVAQRTPWVLEAGSGADGACATLRAGFGRDSAVELRISAAAGGEAGATITATVFRGPSMRSRDTLRLSLLLPRDPAAAVWGMGLQYTVVDLRGRVVPVMTGEQGVGRGLQPLTFLTDLTHKRGGGKWHSSYGPVPHFVTSDGGSVHIDNYEYSEFDFSGDAVTAIRVFFGETVAEPTVVLHASAHASPLQVRRCAQPSHTRARALTRGPRPPTLARSPGRRRVHGPRRPPGAAARLDPRAGRGRGHGGRHRDRARLLAHAARRGRAAVGAVDAGERGRRATGTCPASALADLGTRPLALLQDWCGTRTDSFGERLWWNWVLDEEHYPGWRQLLDDLRADGTRVMGYINPYLAQGNTSHSCVRAHVADRGRG